MRRKASGFTLVELVVVMAVFGIIIAITGSSFNAILTQTSKLMRTEESNIEGVIGLEVLRHDVMQAGFGLYTEQMGINYNEAATAPATSYNDAPGNVPRPIVVGNNVAAVANTGDLGAQNILAGTDYLVVKATTVGRNRTAQKWTYLKYTSNDVYPYTWRSAAENFATNDKVMLLRRQMSGSSQTIFAEPGTTGDFYVPFSASAFSNFTSASKSLYTVYGVDNTATLRMPFNRSDYFVARPQSAAQFPAVCATSTGILYKTTVNQADGNLNYVPLLDCVADMQVVLGWAIADGQKIDTYSSADGSAVSGVGTVAQIQAALGNGSNNSATNSPSIRNNLKMVKIYVLAQQGRRDPGYVSKTPILVGDSGETALTRSYDLTADMLNYRWKVYKIVARPKNLPANQ